MKRSAVFGTATLLWIAIAACVGDDPGGGTTDAPGSDASNGFDGAVNDAPVTPADACSSSCKTADIAIDCAGVERACALGCSPELKACRTFDPAGPLTGSDLAEDPAEADIDLPATPETTIVSTATGAMIHPGGAVRAANGDVSARQTVSGITFERRGGIAIFHARSWTLRNVIVEGDLPVAFVASGDVRVHGHVSTTCGQVGGAPGDAARPGNGGMGGGSSGGAGGGGGGHGGAGGKGADSIGDDDEQLYGGIAGPVFTFDVATPRGGGSGGTAGNGGGRGGGVVMISAGTSVRVGDGVTVSYKPPTSGAYPVPKGVHVGGCGGSGGTPGGKAGSGGGAGGLIVIEAPIVLIDANSGLAANGGGGGGTGTAGRDAKLDDVPPLGGEYAFGGCSTGATGGKGAAGASAAQAGLPNTPSCGEYTYGAGGGGGGGRIVIRNKAGNVDDRAPTSILSPAAALDVQALTTN